MTTRAKNPLLAALDAMARDGRRASIQSTRPDAERAALYQRIGWQSTPTPAAEPQAPPATGVTGGLDR